MFFRRDHAEKTAGPGLVICHGAFEYKENFFDLTAFLAKQGISALVMDMPGHGESSGERYHIDMDLWVRAIRTAVDWLEKDPEIDGNRIGAFGFSSGGTAVLEAALVEPKIKALITLDATVRNYLGFYDTLIFKLLTNVGKIKKRITGKGLRLNILSELNKATVAHDPAVNQALISDAALVAAYSHFPLPGAAATAFVDTIKRIHKIAAPTLVLHGEEDRVDPPDTARVIFNTLTCEKALEFIPQSGHCGHLDTQKETIMQLTADWAIKHL
ncbi:MAG: alpha/beta fold hydrolase [Desulfobacterales bacterium]